MLLLFWSIWFATALVASAVLTQRMIAWAGACGMIDTPNARSSHALPTPRGGGLAIVIVVILAATLAVVLHPESLWPVVGVAVGALLVAAVSWMDDIRSLKNSIRLTVHSIAAIGATALLGPVTQVELGSLATIDLGLAAWPLTLLWIVGLTNAFNFMDGIDGIAGVTAVAAGLAIAAAAGFFHAAAIAGISAALAAAALGFLSCNWPPAKIFMGDVGSAFCGFLLAVLPLAVPDQVPQTLPIAVVALWPFIFDTAYTIVRRLRKRENIFEPHRSHLYQRLTIAGWSHRTVSSLYGCLAALSAGVAVVPLFYPAARATADWAGLSVIVMGAGLLLGLVLVAERSQDKPVRSPSTASSL